MNSNQIMETIGAGIGADLNRILAPRVKDVAEKDSICMLVSKRGILKTYCFPEEVKHGLQELIHGKKDEDFLFCRDGNEDKPEDYFLQKMIRRYEAETGDTEYGKFLISVD